MLGHPQSHHGVARIFSNCGAKVLASGKPCSRSEFNNANSSDVSGREVKIFSSSIEPAIVKESLNNLCRQASIPSGAKAHDDFAPFPARPMSCPFKAANQCLLQNYPECRMCITSPSCTIYSLPSRRRVPRLRAAASEPASSSASQRMVSARMKWCSRSE